MTQSVTAFVECCHAIVAHCPDQYAKAYAKAGIDLVESRQFDALPTQVLYILSNLSYWRGEQARDIRATLKHIAKKWDV